MYCISTERFRYSYDDGEQKLLTEHWQFLNPLTGWTFLVLNSAHLALKASLNERYRRSHVKGLVWYFGKYSAVLFWWDFDVKIDTILLVNMKLKPVSLAKHKDWRWRETASLVLSNGHCNQPRNGGQKSITQLVLKLFILSNFVSRNQDTKKLVIFFTNRLIDCCIK